MQMTTDARVWLDATVRRILARQPLGDAERAGITDELMSHLHAAGEARATAAGRSEVTREDLQVALAEAGGDDGLATAFTQPLAKPVERVLFGRRLGAFAIDALLLGIVLTFVHGMLGYFMWFEAHEGRTPGKRALELRVMRVDGRPVTYRESFIRNLVNVALPLLFIDSLIMLMAFGDDKQRGSDKIAETVVARA